MPSKTRSKSKGETKPSTLEDDVLTQLLLDVGTPQRRAAPDRPNKLSSCIKRIKLEVEPPLEVNSHSPIVSQPQISESTPISKPLAEDWPLEDTLDGIPEDRNDEIKVTPLDDDLKTNLEFHNYKDEGSKYTRFYWYDSCEDTIKNPGVVYFFGRVLVKSTNNYISCCTIVKNITRTYYLLIKEDTDYRDVVAEFTNIISKQYKIKNFKFQEVDMKYAFSNPEDNIPLLGKYAKLDCPVDQPILPANVEAQTFTKVLNRNQTPMEKIILELKLRGPCWLKLIDPVASGSQISWARIELVLERPDNLVVEEPSNAPKAPYFCAFSLCLRTYTNPISHQNEIIAITGMYNKAFNLDQCLKKENKASGHFMIMTKPVETHKELKLPYDYQVKLNRYKRTRFELVESERDLLTTFMEKFSNLDPDIVIGHDLLNFDYETLVVRMKTLKVGIWSKLGRFRRTEIPSTKAAFRYTFNGRALCDIRASAMELIHARSYDLNELVLQVLKQKRVEYNQEAVVSAFKSSENLITLLDATWDDNNYIFSILVELNVIPLALKITNITGNILSRTLAAGRSERNEYLLLHAFHEDGYICPEKLITSKFKRFNQAKTKLSDECVKENVAQAELAPTRKKAAYSGGLVLEPKTGYYDNYILLMDFNSLYPSIIQEFNICFSTVKIPSTEGLKDANTELIANVPDDNLPNGVLPTQLRNLVNSRRRVKKLIEESKSPERRMILDIEQKALKLTANSMYGCLGFEQSRFYAKHLASLVTFKGREILMSTKTMVENLGYEVIYGDTDSLMINTKVSDYDEVIIKGNAIKSDINKRFKLLEIDIDGVYRPLLLLKKKNYAGASIKKLANGDLMKSIETKGLDTVRRDRAVIAKEAGEKVLSMILACDKDIDLIVDDIHNYLRQLGEDIRANQITPEKFLISKQLNRNPEDYRDTKGIGHVSLAIRHNNDTKKGRKMKAGDTVEYVICLDNTNESANQRAYSLDEMKENTELKLDYEYYLCQQLHPIMTRICDKLPTTNAYTLAEMLGIEKSHMLQIKREETEIVKRDQLLSKGESRFNSCTPLVINCPNCKLPDEISTRTRRNKSKKLEMSLTQCPQCGFLYSQRDKMIVAQIISMIRKHMLELFNTKYICENSECDYQTRNVFGQTSANGQLICDLCDSLMQPEMDDRKLDLQLCYYKHLFDMSKEKHLFTEESDNKECSKLSNDLEFMYEKCYKEVEYNLRSSSSYNIDAYKIFSMICSSRTLEQDELLPY